MRTQCRFLTKEAMEEHTDGEEDDRVGIDHIPPQRLLARVRQLLLQLCLFFF